MGILIKFNLILSPYATLPVHRQEDRAKSDALSLLFCFHGLTSIMGRDVNKCKELCKKLLS